jgi:hypothetical protein
MNIFIETGKKKVFVGAVDWPGWSRWGRDEESAIESFLDYGARYASVLEETNLGFVAPEISAELNVVETHTGNITTDFGAPDVVLEADLAPLDSEAYARAKEILSACWQVFDTVVEKATGKELRKGPRGGGRDLEKVIEHVVEADRQYLRRQARSYKREKGSNAQDELLGIRQAIFEALDAAKRGELPPKGPRGGKIWTPRYFIRRVVWHVLDHAWEIEDRVV